MIQSTVFVFSKVSITGPPVAYPLKRALQAPKLGSNWSNPGMTPPHAQAQAWASIFAFF